MRARAAAVVAATAALGLGTVAVAQTVQVNEYDVQADVKPNKVGTKSRPLPVGLTIGWTMSEASGLRAASVERYTINVYGGRENTDLFPTCSAQQINDAQTDADCPKGARFGSGYLQAEIGPDNDVSSRAIKCRLPIVLYNGGDGRAAIFLETGPPVCPVTISQAIDARFVDAFGGKGRGLQFSVPQNLLHPITGMSVAVVEVETKLPRKTTRVKGQRRGFLESTVPCDDGERYVEVEFVTEGGARDTVRDSKRC